MGKDKSTFIQVTLERRGSGRRTTIKRSIIRSLLERGRLFVYLTSLLAVGSVLGVGQARAQAPDPSLKPTYGSVKVKSGFEPDPFSKKLEAGGPIKTKLGGVTQFVSRAPDFRLNYTAGEFLLRIYVEAKGDTTLLVNLPDGTWKANDDGGDGKNPNITFNNPKSGQYDIWVGTFRPKNVENATLKISEKDVFTPATPKVKTITLLNVDWFRSTADYKYEMRVYQIGQTSEIYKTRRSPKGVWKLNQGPWAMGKKGVDIQIWWIDNNVFQKDQKLGSIRIGTNAPSGVRSQEFKDGSSDKYTLKYRIDN